MSCRVLAGTSRRPFVWCARVARQVAVMSAALMILPGFGASAAANRFNALAFYTGKNDQAHISFVREASRWFSRMAVEHGFTYEATTNWSQMNAERLARSQVVLFLDTRPEDASQREAFERYMRGGGAWSGCWEM